jgi:hypothetical protein
VFLFIAKIFFLIVAYPLYCKHRFKFPTSTPRRISVCMLQVWICSVCIQNHSLVWDFHSRTTVCWYLTKMDTFLRTLRGTTCFSGKDSLYIFWGFSNFYLQVHQTDDSEPPIAACEYEITNKNLSTVTVKTKIMCLDMKPLIVKLINKTYQKKWSQPIYPLKETNGIEVCCSLGNCSFLRSVKIVNAVIGNNVPYGRGHAIGCGKRNGNDIAA